MKVIYSIVLSGRPVAGGDSDVKVPLTNCHSSYRPSGEILYGIVTGGAAFAARLLKARTADLMVVTR